MNVCCMDLWLFTWYLISIMTYIFYIIIYYSSPIYVVSFVLYTTHCNTYFIMHATMKAKSRRPSIWCYSLLARYSFQWLWAVKPQNVSETHCANPSNGRHWVTGVIHTCTAVWTMHEERHSNAGKPASVKQVVQSFDSYVLMRQ